MKTLAVIALVLILALAWNQNRTIQNSNTAGPVSQDLAVSADLKKVQKNETDVTPRAPAGSQARNAAVQAGGARNYNSPSTQRPSRARQQYEQSQRALAGTNSPAGAAYNQQRQAQDQRYTQRQSRQRPSSGSYQRANPDRPSPGTAYSAERPSWQTAGRQQDFRYGDDPVDSVHGFNGNDANTSDHVVRHGNQTAAGSRAAGVYKQTPNPQAANRPNAQSVRVSQPPDSARFQPSSSQPAFSQTGYRKDGEPDNCIYRDDRIYCR